MMRGLVFLALISAGAADKEGVCALDSAKATTAVIDSVLNIWAATKRCNTTKYQQAANKYKPAFFGSDVETAPMFCVMDVAGSIKSLTDLGLAVSGMASQCGMIGKGTGAACGETAAKLVTLTAGLAQAGGRIDEWCGPEKYCWKCHHKQRSGPFSEVTTVGQCASAAGKSVEHIGKLYNSVKGIEKKCKGGGKWCAASVMGVMSTIGAFGSYLTYSVAGCAMVDKEGVKKTNSAYQNNDNTRWTKAEADFPKFQRPANCAAAIELAVTYLSGMGALGIVMQDKCKPKDSRLYLDTDIDNSGKTATSLPTVLALAAAIPLAAVLSFIAGTKLSKKSRTTRQIMAVTEDAQLLNVEE